MLRVFVVRLSVTFGHKAGRSMFAESAVDGLAEWLYEVFEQRALSGLDHYFSAGMPASTSTRGASSARWLGSISIRARK